MSAPVAHLAGLVSPGRSAGSLLRPQRRLFDDAVPAASAGFREVVGRQPVAGASPAAADGGPGTHPPLSPHSSTTRSGPSESVTPTPPLPAPSGLRAIAAMSATRAPGPANTAASDPLIPPSQASPHTPPSPPVAAFKASPPPAAIVPPGAPLPIVPATAHPTRPAAAAHSSLGQHETTTTRPAMVGPAALDRFAAFHPPGGDIAPALAGTRRSGHAAPVTATAAGPAGPPGPPGSPGPPGARADTARDGIDTARLRPPSSAVPATATRRPEPAPTVSIGTIEVTVVAAPAAATAAAPPAHPPAAAAPGRMPAAARASSRPGSVDAGLRLAVRRWYGMAQT